MRAAVGHGLRRTLQGSLCCCRKRHCNIKTSGGDILRLLVRWSNPRIKPLRQSVMIATGSAPR